MRLATGDMLLNPFDVLFFTANNVVNNGKLVMGAGAARAVKDKWPTTPTLLGQKILLKQRSGFFGIVYCQQHNGIIGAFQSKYHWKNPSSLDLIKSSCEQLSNFAILNISKRISLNFPGIGFGGLKRTDVLPLLEILPDNVTVWER